MLYQIDMGDHIPVVDTLLAVVRDLDPSGEVQYVPGDRQLRIDADIEADELVEVLGRAGYTVAQGQGAKDGSTCCGGCGGSGHG